MLAERDTDTRMITDALGHSSIRVTMDNARHRPGESRRGGGEGQVKGGGLEEQRGQETESDPTREERRRVRRRRKLRLKAALLGRSRGGQTSKVHLAADRKCRPLAFILTAGHAADSPQFIRVLKKVRVRGPVGRPRTRPDAVTGDKAYSSRGNRAHLRKRRIKAVIPEKKGQAANRKKKGSGGGRPVSHDTALYKERNTVERAINRVKAWRGIATRYDKTPGSYRRPGGPSRHRVRREQFTRPAPTGAGTKVRFLLAREGLLPQASSNGPAGPSMRPLEEKAAGAGSRACMPGSANRLPPPAGC